MKKNLKNCLKMSEVKESHAASVPQAVQHLLYNLPFRKKMEVAVKAESELPMLNTSLGKYIQNEFALEANMALIESCLKFSDNGAVNAKDASQIIIKEFWKQLKAASYQSGN